MNVKKLLIALLFSIAFLSFKPIAKKIIVIDAGHGGNDMGVNYQGISEKKIVLDIASQIRELNNSQSKYEIVLTRDNDSYPSLTDRTDKINSLNPEMVISLHVNGTPENQTPKNGHEIFVQNSDASKNLAEKISKKLGSCSISEKNLHILRESKSPTVLIELGYINNKEDRNYLSSKKGQKEIAQKFVEFFNEQ